MVLLKQRMFVIVLFPCVILFVCYQWSELSSVELSKSSVGDTPPGLSVLSMDNDTDKLQEKSRFEKYSQEINDLIDDEKRQDNIRDRKTNDSVMTIRSSPWPKSARTIMDYPWRNSSELPRPISRGMHDEFIDLLKTLMGLFDSTRVSYVMGSGSMIGVYTFHHMIPWNDDVDIWVDYRDLPKIKCVLRNTSLRQSYGAQAYCNDRFPLGIWLENLDGVSRERPWWRILQMVVPWWYSLRWCGGGASPL